MFSEPNWQIPQIQMIGFVYVFTNMGSENVMLKIPNEHFSTGAIMKTKCAKKNCQHNFMSLKIVSKLANDFLIILRAFNVILEKNRNCAMQSWCPRHFQIRCLASYVIYRNVHRILIITSFLYQFTMIMTTGM